MKTRILLLLGFMPMMLAAQSGLQFSRVFTLSNSAQTVPAGKVWKVTAVYGQESRVNECVDFSIGSTHEIGTRARCGSSGLPSTVSARFNYAIRGIILNNIPVVFSTTGFSICPSSNIYASNNCTSTTNNCTYWNSNANWSCVNLANDPNVLPIWLEAGSSIETLGPNTFASVIEFTIMP